MLDSIYRKLDLITDRMNEMSESEWSELKNWIDLGSHAGVPYPDIAQEMLVALGDIDKSLEKIQWSLSNIEPEPEEDSEGEDE